MHWKESGMQFENPPVGSHIARCYAVIDLGTQAHTWQGETRMSRDVRISFELPGEKMTGKYNADAKGKPFSVNLTTKQSLHHSSRLRKILKGWRGRDFTKEELAGFEAKNILGAPCRLTLVASENGDYVNVDSISPLGKNEKCPKQVNKSVYFSLDPDQFDDEVLQSLHERTREKIEASPEFQALDGSGPPEPDPEPEHAQSREPTDDNTPF